MRKKRLTALAFAMVLVSFMLSTAVSLWSLHRMGQSNMREIDTVLAARVYETIARTLNEPITIARTMAHDSFLITALEREDSANRAETESQLRNYLSGIRGALNYETAFVISEQSRRYYNYNGIAKVVDPQGSPYDAWYASFVDGGLSYDLDVDTDEMLNDDWSVFVNARVEDPSGRLLGVCGVSVHMDNLQTMFERYEAEYGVKVSLVDENGLVQVDADPERIERDTLPLPENVRGNRRDYVHWNTGKGGFVVARYVEGMDWFLVTRSVDDGSRGTILNVVLLNVALCALVLVVMLLSMRHIMRRTIALSNASFRDEITRLYNRRAFEEAKEALRTRGPGDDFVFVSIDINGLKTANDTLGHDAGDELIIGAADCLRAAFGKYGQIYRVGGDEFTAMLSLSPDALERAKADLADRIARWSGKQVKSLSLSCGYASRREFPTEDPDLLHKKSDERMYAEKAEYYKRMGIERRRT